MYYNHCIFSMPYDISKCVYVCVCVCVYIYIYIYIYMYNAASFMDLFTYN